MFPFTVSVPLGRSLSHDLFSTKIIGYNFMRTKTRKSGIENVAERLLILRSGVVYETDKRI